MISRNHRGDGGSITPLEYGHRRHHSWKQPHRKWQFWVAIVLMIAMVLVYTLSDNLGLRPGRPARAPQPALGAP